MMQEPYRKTNNCRRCRALAGNQARHCCEHVFCVYRLLLFFLQTASFCSYTGLHRALGRWRSYQFGQRLSQGCAQ